MSALSPAVRNAALMNLADRMASAADQWPQVWGVVWRDPTPYRQHKAKPDPANDSLPAAPPGHMTDVPGFDAFNDWPGGVECIPHLAQSIGGHLAVGDCTSPHWRVVIFGPGSALPAAEERLTRQARDAETYLPPNDDASRPRHPVGRLLTHASELSGVEAWGQRSDHPYIWQERNGPRHLLVCGRRPASELYRLSRAIGDDGWRPRAWCAYLPSVFSAGADYVRGLAAGTPPSPPPTSSNGLRHPFKFFWGGRSIDLAQDPKKYPLLSMLWNIATASPADPTERTAVLESIWPDDDEADESLNSLLKNINKDFRRAEMPLMARRNSGFVWLDVLP